MHTDYSLRTLVVAVSLLGSGSRVVLALAMGMVNAAVVVFLHGCRGGVLGRSRHSFYCPAAR
jgi:hypothetical protein